MILETASAAFVESTLAQIYKDYGRGGFCHEAADKIEPVFDPKTQGNSILSFRINPLGKTAESCGKP